MHTMQSFRSSSIAALLRDEQRRQSATSHSSLDATETIFHHPCAAIMTVDIHDTPHTLQILKTVNNLSLSSCPSLCPSSAVPPHATSCELTCGIMYRSVAQSFPRFHFYYGLPQAEHVDLIMGCQDSDQYCISHQHGPLQGRDNKRGETLLNWQTLGFRLLMMKNSFEHLLIVHSKYLLFTFQFQLSAFHSVLQMYLYNNICFIYYSSIRYFRLNLTHSCQL